MVDSLQAKLDTSKDCSNSCNFEALHKHLDGLSGRLEGMAYALDAASVKPSAHLEHHLQHADRMDFSDTHILASSGDAVVQTDVHMAECMHAGIQTTCDDHAAFGCATAGPRRPRWEELEDDAEEFKGEARINSNVIAGKVSSEGTDTDKKNKKSKHRMRQTTLLLPLLLRPLLLPLASQCRLGLTRRCQAPLLLSPVSQWRTCLAIARSQSRLGPYRLRRAT